MGINLRDTDDSAVQGNTVTAGKETDIYLQNASRNSIIGNAVSSTGEDGVADQAGILVTTATFSTD